MPFSMQHSTTLAIAMFVCMSSFFIILLFVVVVAAAVSLWLMENHVDLELELYVGSLTSF